MQDEPVNVGSQFGDQERHPARIDRDEVNIAAETIELGNDDGTFSSARCFRESR